MRIFIIFANIFALLGLGSCCNYDARARISQVTEPRGISEGPHWDVENQVLYFVDIRGQAILRYNPATGQTTQAYIKNGPTSVVVPVASRPNTFLVGSGTDLIEVTWNPNTNDSNPQIKVLSTVDTDRHDTRFNDGKVDPAGRFWAGTMGERNREAFDNAGSLYRFDADGTPTTVLRPVSISNGLCWSHDNKTFYYIDSPTLQVAAYDFDVASGGISNKRVIFTFDMVSPGEVPDGMTIDKRGNLWVADNGGGRVVEIDPNTGEELGCVSLPALRVSSLAFGGPNLETLYVTTASEGLTTSQLREQPGAGAVFAVYGLGDTGAPMLDAIM